jgi:hypothetical protein
MLKHKQPMTPVRAKRVGESYRQMFGLASMLDLEYTQHMDVDFKSQAVHNHVKTILKSIQFILRHHKAGVDTSAEEPILDGLHDLNEINKMFLGMSSERIQAFAAGMRREIAKEQEGEVAA